MHCTVGLRSLLNYWERGSCWVSWPRNHAASAKYEVTVWAAGNFPSTLVVVKPFRSSRIPLCLGLRQRQITCNFFGGKTGRETMWNNVSLTSRNQNTWGNHGRTPDISCAQVCPFVTSQAFYTMGIWLVDCSVWRCYWCFELCSVTSYCAAFTDDSLQRFWESEQKNSTCKASRGGTKRCCVKAADMKGSSYSCYVVGLRRIAVGLSK